MSNSFMILNDYEARYLGYHLNGAHDLKKWRSLLSKETASESNAWFDLKFSRGLLESFFDDLDLARTESALNGGPANLDIQLRVALYRTLRGCISNIPIQLIRQLLECGLWTGDQVRSVLALRDNFALSDESLAVGMSDTNESSLVNHFYDVALRTQSDADRAGALVSLLPRLPVEKKKIALEAAIDAARSTSWDDAFDQTNKALHPGIETLRRVRTLIALAKEAEAPKRADLSLEALRYAVSMANSENKSIAIREVAGIGEPELIKPALQAIAQWRGSDAAFVLIALAKSATAQDGARLLERALRELERDDSELRFIALQDLVPLLPCDLLHRVLALSGQLDNKWEKAHVLASLSNRLDWPYADTVLREAVNAICIMENDWNRPELFLSLGTRIPVDCLRDVYSAIADIDSSEDRIRGYAMALTFAPISERSYLLKHCSRSAASLDPFYKKAALSALIKSLSYAAGEDKAALLQIISSIAESIADKKDKMEVALTLTTAIESIPNRGAIKRYLEASMAYSDSQQRLSAQVALIACLLRVGRDEITLYVNADNRLKRAMVSVAKDRYAVLEPWALLNGLGIMLGRPAPVRRADLVAMMISVAESIEEPLERAEAFASIASLDESRSRELALKSREAIRKIERIHDRAEALIGLAVQYPDMAFEQMLSEAEDLVELIDNGSYGKPDLLNWLNNCRARRIRPHAAQRALNATSFLLGDIQASQTSVSGPAGFRRCTLRMPRPLEGKAARWRPYDIETDEHTYISMLSCLAVSSADCKDKLLAEAIATAWSCEQSEKRIHCLEALLSFGTLGRDYVLDILDELCKSGESTDYVGFAVRHLENEGSHILEATFERLRTTSGSPLTSSYTAFKWLKIIPFLQGPALSVAVSEVQSAIEENVEWPYVVLPWRLGIYPFLDDNSKLLLAKRMLNESANDPELFVRTVVGLLDVSDAPFLKVSVDRAVKLLESLDERAIADVIPGLSRAIGNETLNRILRRLQTPERLLKLIDKLPPTVNSDLLRLCAPALHDVRQDDIRAAALAAIAVRSPPAQRRALLKQVIALATSVYDSKVRYVAFCCIAKHISCLSQEDKIEALSDIFMVSGDQPRRQVCERISATRDLIYEVGGTDVIIEALLAIHTCGQWWP